MLAVGAFPSMRNDELDSELTQGMEDVEEVRWKASEGFLVEDFFVKEAPSSNSSINSFSSFSRSSSGYCENCAQKRAEEDDKLCLLRLENAKLYKELELQEQKYKILEASLKKYKLLEANLKCYQRVVSTAQETLQQTGAALLALHQEH